MSNFEIQDENEHSSKNKKSNKSCRTPPKVQYKGITLKEYFRLCDQVQQNPQIDETDEQSRASSKHSLVQTPAFGLGQPLQATKMRNNKIKTEVQDAQNNQFFAKPNLANLNNYRNQINMDKSNQNNEQKGIWNVCQQFYQKKTTKNSVNNHNNPYERKRVVSIPTKSSKQFLNRSTLSSFYQLEKKKKKMLNKLKAQKERINESQLSDAFFITKYAFKFKLDQKSFK